VADRFVELGQLVAAGTPVVRIIDPYTLKLEAYLTEQQVGWVAPGTTAAVQLAGAGGDAPGTVTWVGFEADRLTGKFKVEIRIPNPDLSLRSGVIGRARVGKNVVQDAVVIPRDAILNGRIGPTAYVVEQDRAVLRQLTLGPAQGLMVVVREGLRLGDQLVVRGQRDLREGGLVLVTEVAESADGSRVGDPAGQAAAGVDSRVRTAPEAEAGR
jgi:membrane fusion protein (multidrug efflux system)